MLKEKVNIPRLPFKVDCIKEISNFKAQFIIDEAFFLQLDRPEINGVFELGGQVCLKELLNNFGMTHHRPDVTIMGGNPVLWHGGKALLNEAL
jgi:hypothetical protein